MTKLEQLAQDLITRFDCSCYVDDLPYDEQCDCGGDGRVEGGGMGAEEGCFVCQAKAALESVPQ